MQSKRHLALSLYSLFALVSGVEAQAIAPVLSPPAGATAASIEHIDLSVYAIAYAEGHQTVYLTDSQSAVSEIALSSANILGPYHTVLDANSNIILSSKTVTAEGTITYPTIAQATLSSHIKEPVMILVPSNESLPYQSIIIDQSLEHFAMGSYMLINLSPMKLRGTVGSNQVEVSTEGVTTIIPSSEDEDSLNVHFEYERPQGWKTFARTRWMNEKSKRSLLLAYLDPQTKRMKIKGIPVKPIPEAHRATP